MKSEEEKKEKDYVVKERREGQYTRTFTLPAAVDAGKAAATFADGVLTLRLPRSEKVRPIQIAVDGRPTS
jgi:HSP20 family protein